MNLKAILLAIQALPAVIRTMKILARMTYPLTRPILKRAVNDPNTTHDEDFMDVVDSAIIGKVKSKGAEELGVHYRERDEKAKLKK